MLGVLMDGRAHTAKELAYCAGISAQTASGHLAHLTQGGLTSVVAQGRHRYYRLAGPHVAQVVEALMHLAETASPRRRPPSRASVALADARLCYDHFAGRFGVALHDALVARGCLAVTADGYGLTPAGLATAGALEIDVEELARRGRTLVRPCLDWTERRPHLAGRFAAAFASRCVECGYVERDREGRAVRLTGAGRRALGDLGLIACDAAVAA
jgi:hypothetical protein